jgi:hypothetical protein
MPCFKMAVLRFRRRSRLIQIPVSPKIRELFGICDVCGSIAQVRRSRGAIMPDSNHALRNRQRANEARRAASAIRDSQMRVLFLRIAEDFEYLAKIQDGLTHSPNSR